MSLLIFLLVLNTLVLVHEFGHFIFAKLFGVTVKEFAIGIGPKLWGKVYKNTLFSIRLIPFGGFNDIKGQEHKEKGNGNFFTLQWYKKLIILLGGILFNIIFAVTLLYVYLFANKFVIHMPIKMPAMFAQMQTIKKPGVIVVDVANDSSLKETFNDLGPLLIEKFNDQKVESIDKFIKQLKQFTDSNPNINAVHITLKSLKNNEIKELDVTLNKNKKLGVVITPNEDYMWKYNKSFLTKITSGFTFSVDLMKANVDLLSQLIEYVIKTHDYKPAEYAVSGPVGIYKVIDMGTKSGQTITYFLYLTGLLSLSLAIFNLIPFPGLDGWHIVIVLISAISGGRLYNKRVYKYITIAGLILLIIFSIIITYKDIRLFFF